MRDDKEFFDEVKEYEGGGIISFSVDCAVKCPKCKEQFDVAQQLGESCEWCDFVKDLHTSGYKPDIDLECPTCEHKFKVTKVSG